MSSVDLNAVRATAAAAGWVYGHPMLENDRTMYAQASGPAGHGHVGSFGTFRHDPQPSRPESTDILTPNNDTPYSWCRPDELRAIQEQYALRTLSALTGTGAPAPVIYGPDKSVLDGTWRLPDLTVGG